MQAIFKRKLKIGKVKEALMISIISVALLLLPQERAEASAMDYFSGCLMAMGGGLAGTALANTRLEEGEQIDGTGYAVSGVLSCLAGMAYVGVTSSSAKFNAEYQLKKENETLTYELKRLSKEKCLLSGTCTAESNAIIVEKEAETRKMGDSVYSGSVSTIETND